jgi:hypothetical protein
MTHKRPHNVYFEVAKQAFGTEKNPTNSSWSGDDDRCTHKANNNA